MQPPEEITITGVMETGIVTTLKDGRLLMLCCEHEAVENLSAPRTERWGYSRYSTDDGRTWSEPHKAMAYPPGPGVAIGVDPPVPLVTRNGDVHAFALRYLSLGNASGGRFQSTVLHTVSSDGGRTWSAPRPVDFGYSYTGQINCAVQLDSGRILVPLSCLDEQRTNGRFVVRVVYSDDNGQTWQQSNNGVVSHGGGFLESGAMEPVIVQRADGMAWMIIRTTTGYFWESFANDGATWTPPICTRIVSSNAPAGVLRLRDGRIVLVWNQCYGEPFHQGVSYARQVLHGAISQDEGQTWSSPKVIAQTTPDTLDVAQMKAAPQACYPFLCQASDGAMMLVYYVIHQQIQRGWNNPIRRLVRIDPNWLASY